VIYFFVASRAYNDCLALIAQDVSEDYGEDRYPAPDEGRTCI
jgi:hypothetical protein